MRTLVFTQLRITKSSGEVIESPGQYFLRAVGGSCEEDVTAFQAISQDAKEALPTAKPAGTWNRRNCAGVVESQPAVVTEFPDQEFTTAAVRTITIPASNFSGGNLVFTGTRGDLDPLRDGITFNPATRAFTLPATLTEEWYVLRIVATNSVGSIDDKFSVHLTHNGAGVTDILDVVILPENWEGSGTTPEVPSYDTEGELGETYTA